MLRSYFKRPRNVCFLNRQIIPLKMAKVRTACKNMPGSGFTTFFCVASVLMLSIVLLTISACEQEAGYQQEFESREREEKSEPPPFVVARQSADAEGHFQALVQAQNARLALSKTGIAGKGKWQFAGPANLSGRITDIAMHPTDTNTIYAASASGGIFKSSDSGRSWQPLFDQQLSLSMGSIAIDPIHSNILYAGTGEANAGGGSITYDGTGMYKSVDGGDTWESAGLTQTGSIARIAINPSNPQQLYAAAMGKLFANNPERGLFRSNNGGKTWEKTLYISDATGCVDVVIHPSNPDIVYAVMWERVRRPNMRKYGGPNCGIYRSTDAGSTWTKLNNGLPLTDLGRIGIAISASNPNILYAVYADEQGYFKGIFKTADAGNQWVRLNDRPLRNLYENYGWWFGVVRIHPQNPDNVYVLGLDLYRTLNGGKTWQNISTKAVHVDQHALYIHPLNPQLLVLGNDGGICISNNGGDIWHALLGPPVVQFYTCEIDQKNYQILYGGSQDNGIMRTFSGQENEWEIIVEGDGFGVLLDPTNHNMLYTSYQYGSLLRSFDGAYTLHEATEGISMDDRKIWNTPFLIDPIQPYVLYYGANRLYQSTDRAVQWFPVSPNLAKEATNNNVVYGAISTMAVAPSNNDFVYVGTDDGNLWATYNNCANWVDISAGLPIQWVSRIAVNPSNENTAYVAFSGYRKANYQPHLFKTDNAGKSWTNISANLPQAPVNDIIIDPTDTATIFVATDVGVFVTLNHGDKWQMLGDNLPPVPITDLCLQQSERILVAATYGRGMFTFSLQNNLWRMLPYKSEN